MESKSYFPRNGGKKGHLTSVSQVQHSGIAYLVVSIGGQQHKCTGFLVRVEYHFIIVTAAQNLYDRKIGKASRVAIFLGRSGEDYTHGVLLKKLQNIQVHEKYMNGDVDFDFGYIYLLPEDYDFLKLDYFTLCDWSTNQVRTSPAYIGGYPAKNNDIVLQTETTITDYTLDELYMYYQCAAPSGCPGSPIYVKEKGILFVVGITVQETTLPKGYNKALLISAEVLSYTDDLLQGLHQLSDDIRATKLKIDPHSNLNARQPRDRRSYQEERIRHRPVQRCNSVALTVNIASELDRVTALSLPFADYDQHTGYYPDKREAEVIRTGLEGIAGVEKREIPAMKYRFPMQTSPKYPPFEDSFPQKTIHYAERISTPGQGEDGVQLLPSNMPIAPKVMQFGESFRQIEELSLKTDCLNIFPPCEWKQSPILCDLYDTLTKIASCGLLLLSSSLLQLLHISHEESTPEDVFFELFGSIPGLDPFVLAITLKPPGENVKTYTTHLNQKVIHRIRMFTDESISSIFGTMAPEHLDSPKKFKEALMIIKEESGIFANPNSLLMNMKKSYSVSKSCLLSMLLIDNTSDMSKPVAIGSSADLHRHWDNMNGMLRSRIWDKSHKDVYRRRNDEEMHDSQKGLHHQVYHSTVEARGKMLEVNPPAVKPQRSTISLDNRGPSPNSHMTGSYQKTGDSITFYGKHHLSGFATLPRDRQTNFDTQRSATLPSQSTSTLPEWSSRTLPQESAIRKSLHGQTLLGYEHVKHFPDHVTLSPCGQDFHKTLPPATFHEQTKATRGSSQKSTVGRGKSPFKVFPLQQPASTALVSEYLEQNTTSVNQSSDKVEDTTTEESADPEGSNAYPFKRRESLKHIKRGKVERMKRRFSNPS